MTKTINFELSKRLNELGLLDNIETEYFYTGHYNYEKDDYCNWVVRDFKSDKLPNIKTLTLEEGIKFLPLQIYNDIDDDGTYAKLRLNVNPVGALPYYFTYYDIEAGRDIGPCDEFENVIGALEKMIDWLIEEKYITKEQWFEFDVKYDAGKLGIHEEYKRIKAKTRGEAIEKIKEDFEKDNFNIIEFN